MIVVLTASACVTTYIWSRIYASEDSVLMKVVLAITVAIPVIGPLFWPFLSMPPRTRQGVLSSPFKGPVGLLPHSPRWAAVAYRIAVVLLALVVAAVHFAMLREIAK